MVPEASINEQFVGQQHRCEITKALLAEEECRRLGEVWLDGSLLCMSHAELLRLRKRGKSLLGQVFEMDWWLDGTDGETDELRVRRVEQQRNELVKELRFNRTRMDLIHDELLNG